LLDSKANTEKLTA